MCHYSQEHIKLKIKSHCMNRSWITDFVKYQTVVIRETKKFENLLRKIFFFYYRLCENKNQWVIKIKKEGWMSVQNCMASNKGWDLSLWVTCVNLLVELEKKSGDYLSQKDLSSGDYKCLFILARHFVDVQTFYKKSETFDLLAELDKNSGDNWSNYESSSGHHECVHQISWPSTNSYFTIKWKT